VPPEVALLNYNGEEILEKSQFGKKIRKRVTASPIVQ
jgi:hypothetical protein